MVSRSRIRSLTATLAAALLAPGFAAAQTPPADQPPAAPPPAAAPAETVTAPAPAPAAEEAAAPGKKKMGEEIVVTGSRIRRKDLTTPAPVTVLSREQVQASGKVSIGDYLQSLPEQGSALNTAVNNGGDNSIRISLRNLGDSRTLVLVNGRRYVNSGLGADSSVDLSTIPTSAVERIEVLKDGASAMYGSDAIAGVVNIITRKKYNGLEANAYVGTAQHGGGTVWDVSATWGHTTEKGSVMLSAEYYRQEAVGGGQRSWAATPLGYDGSADGSNSTLGVPGEYPYWSSTTVPDGTFSIPSKDSSTGKCRSGVQFCAGNPAPNPSNDPKVAMLNQLITQYPKATKFIHDPNKPIDDPTAWRPFVTALPAQGGDAYNANPENYIITPSQRINLFSTGDYKLGEWARAYYEASYSNRQSQQLLAPEPLALSPGAYPAAGTVVWSKDNIYNPFGVDITSLNRRLYEFGGRSRQDDVDTFRFVAGFDGTLPDAFGPLRGWFWDTSFNYGRNTSSLVRTGNLFVPGISSALGPSFVDPTTGAPTCGTPGAPVDNCVPLNLYGGKNSITPAQQRNLTYTGVDRGVNQMFGVQANLSGELVTIPTADRPIGIAVGYEYLSVLGQFIPNPIVALGLSTTNAQAVTSGGYFSNAGYAELNIPVLSRMPFAESLEVTAAARVFGYSNFGSDWTYKLGARWTPVQDVTFRGTYSTAFRAPSISEAYLGQQQNFANVSDPCAGSPAPANCGAAAGNGDDRPQLPSTQGGNPNLKPETAKIWTLGLVVEPRWVKNLTFTVDYYNIKIENTIGTVGEQLILSSCYPTTAGTASKYCNLITRDATTQQITNMMNTTQNIGGYSTSGIDLAARYVLPTADLGRFGLVFDGTWLNHFDIRQADGSIITARGNFDYQSQFSGGLQGVLPAWKFNAGVNWAAPPTSVVNGLSAALNMRFVGSWHECGDPNGDFSGSGFCETDNTYRRSVPAWTSFDLFVNYAFITEAGKTAVGAGVQNLFDTDPAKIYNAFQFNSDGTAYDFMGRYFYLRVSHSI
jgi:iron complex outermembrane recepter protein